MKSLTNDRKLMYDCKLIYNQTLSCQFEFKLNGVKSRYLNGKVQSFEKNKDYLRFMTLLAIIIKAYIENKQSTFQETSHC